MAISDRLLLLCPNENQSQQRAHGKTTLPLSQVLQGATLLNAARADYWKGSYRQGYGKARLAAYVFENGGEFTKAIDSLTEAISAARPLRWGDWLAATLREAERLCYTRPIGPARRWLLLDRFALVLFDYARWDEAIEVLKAGIAVRDAITADSYDPQQLHFDKQAAFRRESLIKAATHKLDSKTAVPDMLQRLEEQAAALFKYEKYDAVVTHLDVARAIARWSGHDERAHAYSENALEFRSKISHRWALLEHLVSEAEFFASKGDPSRSLYYANEAMTLFSESPAVLEPILDNEPKRLNIHQRLLRLGISSENFLAAKVMVRPNLTETPLALTENEVTRLAKTLFENPGAHGYRSASQSE
jgi:tetratricopeptide (TPR) repeat protein